MTNQSPNEWPNRYVSTALGWRDRSELVHCRRAIPAETVYITSKTPSLAGGRNWRTHLTVEVVSLAIDVIPQDDLQIVHLDEELNENIMIITKIMKTIMWASKKFLHHG